MSGINKNPTYVEAIPFDAFVPQAAPVASAPSAPAAMEATNVRAPVNEAGAREFLTANKWPAGLQDTFVQNLHRIPIRFFICDDSGSMIASDGHRLMTSGNNSKYVMPLFRPNLYLVSYNYCFLFQVSTVHQMARID